MWEVIKDIPRGRLSTRKYLRFATALLVACFLYIFATAPTTFAADASWSGDSIVFEGNTFTGPTSSNDNASYDLPDGTILYTFLKPSTVAGDTKSKAHVIYFSPGTDPPTATPASYRTYDFNGAVFTNPSSVKKITIEPLDPNTQSETSKGTSSCQIEKIGWMICPVTDFLAWGMDTLYSALIGFLSVQPLQSGNNSMYRAWGVMRNFANVAFIGAFLVVIYSYLVGGGFSNYDIKKMLPRLVIAAILVNVSYWICAIAIDASNILGYSLQDLFTSLREQMVGTETNDNFGWGEVSAYVLSGGAIGTIGILAATGGSAVAGIFLLLGALVTVIFAAFVAVIVLAARQALITILVIVAPLAFVAYLLPNTEKWFEKWQQLLMTMLLLFPIFSIIFGGSQLAGAAIIQNATTLNVLILGMAVQVAPLVITPLLIRFSGGLIGKIAGMANSANKGVLDGAKNWARGNAELHKSRALGTPTKRRNVFRRTAQSMNRGRMYREGMTKTYQAQADNLFSESKKGERLHEAHHWAERDKQKIEKALESHMNKKIQGSSKLLERELNVRVAIDEADASGKRLEAIHEEFRAGHYPQFGPQTSTMSDLMNRNEEATRDLALTGMRKQSAEMVQRTQLTKEMLDNTRTIDGQMLRDYAGGIRGQAGAETVLASAVATSRKEYAERVAEKTQLIKHFNLASKERQDLAMGTDVSVVKDGASYTFRQSDEYAREAAIEDQLKTGSFAQIKAIIDASGAASINPVTQQATNPGATFDYRTTISSAVAQNGLDGKALFWGTKTIDDIAQGKYFGVEAERQAIIYNVVAGKIKDEKLAVQDAAALTSMFDVTSHPAAFRGMTATDRATFDTNYQELKRAARRIMDEPELNKLASESARQVLERFKL